MDDILPVFSSPQGVAALPHFPQLKLPAADQYPLDAPAVLPLGAVYVLSAPAPAVEIRPLGHRQAMPAMIRHTIATRLFDRRLLAAHLAFCAGVAARVPVWSLAYPHQPEGLPQVREMIMRGKNSASQSKPASSIRI